MPTVGLLSPGQMGAAVGAAAAGNGTSVIWAGEGRSDASRRRAEAAGLTDCGQLEDLARSADIILSICPPHDAVDIAAAVSAAGFTGIFADCNAISPRKTRQIGTLFAHGHYVDGGIVGGPPVTPADGTQLYLSGESAGTVAGLFTGSPLGTHVISTEVGHASAMKMVFAAFTKGSTALLTAILAVAEQEGVRDVLEAQWGQAFTEQTHGRVITNSAKAWRFAGEMREIAATFEAAGMPPGFHLAAADVFDALAGFKDSPAPDMETLLKMLAD